MIWPADGALRWRLITDGVMGGVSRGSLEWDIVAGRDAVRLRGDVSTDNNGGFIQIALDLAPNGGAIDASEFTGIALDVCGNDETYGAHLRSTQTTRPQQSWRADFRATSAWRRIQFPFAGFVPHRIDEALDVTRLRRLGIVAIGRAFIADVAIASVAFY